jgi:hypothetical protein
MYMLLIYLYHSYTGISIGYFVFFLALYKFKSVHGNGRQLTLCSRQQQFTIYHAMLITIINRASELQWIDNNCYKLPL